MPLCATLAFDLTYLEMLYPTRNMLTLRVLLPHCHNLHMKSPPPPPKKNLVQLCSFVALAIEQLLDHSVSTCLESRIYHF